MFGIDYAGAPVGLDLAMLIAAARTARRHRCTRRRAAPGHRHRSSGCFGYQLAAAQLGLAALPAGTYQVQLLGGPELTPVDAAANLDLTAPVGGTGSSSP